MYWLVRAEPFNQVAILNKTLSQEFIAPASHLFMSVVSIIPYSGSIDFGIHQRFHDYFYPVLYPSMKVGAIASNPWAQLMSAGGIPMLLIGRLCFCFLYIINAKVLFSRSTTTLVCFYCSCCLFLHASK